MAAVVRKEVLIALDRAEARGEKLVRVIVGLRGADSREPVKNALHRMGVKAVVRETEDLLAVNLSREEIRRVGRLKEHVKAIWLDRPVSAA